MVGAGDSPQISEIVVAALAEDRAAEDATSLVLVPADAMAKGRIVAQSNGVISGVECARMAFLACDPDCIQEWSVGDSDRVVAGQEIMTCSGRARALLAAERTALNLLQQLSGVATATAELVELAAEVQVFDTRKTVVGLRDLQKAAVVHGGGRNQRRDLSDELLLKENHFALSGRDYSSAVNQAVSAANGKVVGVEATTADQAISALDQGATYVLLDNFSIEELPEAVTAIRARHPQAVLEASGGIDSLSIAKLVGSGVNRVSVGAITHSAPALDLSFYLE